MTDIFWYDDSPSIREIDMDGITQQRDRQKFVTILDESRRREICCNCLRGYHKKCDMSVQVTSTGDAVICKCPTVGCGITHKDVIRF